MVAMLFQSMARALKSSTGARLSTATLSRMFNALVQAYKEIGLNQTEPTINFVLNSGEDNEGNRE